MARPPRAPSPVHLRVLAQVERLEAWVKKRLGKTPDESVQKALATLKRVVSQDIEPDPGGGGGPRIKEGVAGDRLISLSDPEMRHGRKSKTKRFNGRKMGTLEAEYFRMMGGIVLGGMRLTMVWETAVTCAIAVGTSAPGCIVRRMTATPSYDEAAVHGTIGVVDIDRGYLASPRIARSVSGRPRRCPTGAA